ncbi:aromatic ring-hydroxylating oxygenase subunit alpha [Paraburkholderia sp. ZP32-5]|uniref:aromatic ring-hydroxylating oxygenase subunit alpha n=1 Tax=Paraburkholderia sp. ZP32-5 TaxID=2883245 RepID=UPI001F1BCD91|nr:aromatic ring-hydroxylating dioxygenase subunit alpha [Paraburkholderia sp. ZP32-5]
MRSWFVVARSRQVGDKPLAVTLLNRPLVIARDREGTLMALDDCCPHRHVPLSLGRMTDDGLQCAYHGWTFRADGRCVSVPGLVPPACAPAARVGSASVMENDGLVWVRLDGHGTTQNGTLPAFLHRLSPSSRRFVWQSTWRARAVDALENFLDAQHTHFVHAGLVRSVQKRNIVEATVSKTPGSIQVDYRGQPTQSGWLYRLFESPREIERAHFCASAAGTAQLEYRYQNGSALYFTLHFSPIDETRVRVHGTLHVENRWAPAWALRLIAWPFLRRVLAQDQAIVEAQQRNRERFRRGEGICSELDLVKPVLDATWLQSSSPCNVVSVVSMSI